MIGFEGLIGAGKTELIKAMSKKFLSEGLKAKPYLEPVDHPYLEKFYQDMERWGLEMQFYLMSRRFRTHMDALRVEWSEGIQTFHDRTIWGDKAFAHMLYRSNLISPLGYDSYLQHRRCMLSFLLPPQIVVWLEVDPEICIERIKKRERACEVGITTEYLSNLRKSYDDVLEELEKKGSKIIVYDYNEFLPIDMIYADLKRELDTHRLIPNFGQEYQQDPIDLSAMPGSGSLGS
ncbi:MAG: deoxynucleoside kinase [Planctomycetota bacterium]|nr:MAG: deoxynucleoside kinase [Planctomycetota bacterium]